MKKFFKALALVLALALVIGVVPAQATSAKIKAKKTLYVDGAKGTSTDGKLTSGYKSRVAIYKLAGDTKSVAADHTYKAVIKSGDSVTKTKKYVYAAELGKSVVEIFKDGESLGTSVITVKKNATDDTLTITEFEDGKEVVCGVEYTVTLPRKGVDTDERRLFVDDKAQTEVEGQPRVYKVKFTKDGDHKVKAEAFQSAELDKATATKEITVKAVMPKPVSAKQVSATSFAATFEGNMEGLITDKDITNQMIYYKIANEPVVTGVVKSVKVEGEVVTVEMYAAFNENTDYYFAYGDAEAVKFHTATNAAKYVDKVVIDKTQTFTVDKTTAVNYKLLNKDGVELKLAQKPSFKVTSGTSGWFTSENNLYFFEAGKVVIEATFDTGEYDETTGKYITVSDSAEVTGAVASAAGLKEKKFSVEVAGGTFDVSKENHTLRMGETTKTLKVKYTFDDSDATVVNVEAGVGGYTIKSVDETVIAIMGNKLIPVNTGSTTVVLYYGTDVKDAFTIQVLDAVKGASAVVKTDKNTLNVAAGTKADGTPYVDEIAVSFDVKGTDGNAYTAYDVLFEQVDGNAGATQITYAPATYVRDANDGFKIVGSLAAFNSVAADQYKTIRVTAKVVEQADHNSVISTATIAFTLGRETAPNSYKLNASKTALETSLKNWGAAGKDPVQASTITVVKTKTTSVGDFACGTDTFKLIDGLNSIPVTGGANGNYVLFSQPSYAGVISASVGTVTECGIDALPTNDITANRIKSGSYVFSGYHVEYDGSGNQIADKKTSLGSASVVVSASDATPSFTILKGEAKDIEGYLPIGICTDTKQVVDAGIKNVIKVTIDGKNTTDNANRVEITHVQAIIDNSVAGHPAYYVRKIWIKFFASDDVTKYGTKEISVNTLFKDK